jgi:tetratricopeptide (TPR) repeat protein
MIFSAAVVAALLIQPPARARQAAGEPVTADVAKFVAQGDRAAKQLDFNTALKDYKKADKAGRHACAACLMRIATAESRLGDLDAAVDAAKKAAKVAGGNPALLEPAEQQLGDLLTTQAGLAHPDQGKLKQAAAAFAAALKAGAAAGQRDTLQYDLDVLLIRRKQAEAGLAGLRTLTGNAGLSPTLASEARKILADPKLAFEVIDWHGPQRGCAARPACARADMGPRDPNAGATP